MVVDAGDGETQTVLSTVSASPPAASFDVSETESKSVQQIYEQSAPGVVQVTSTSVVSGSPFFGPQSATSLGSGFVVDKDGYIVTNYT